ncbi:MAG: hypothetical protein ABI128_14615 [Rhodanobacter sp.]
MSSSPQKPDASRRRPNLGAGFAIGIGIGCAFGVALHSLALGIALGAGIGVAIGAGNSRSCHRKNIDEDR